MTTDTVISRKSRTIHGAFFTPIWRIKLAADSYYDQWERDILAEMERDKEGVVRSNQGGWHSQIGLLRRPAFRALADCLEEQIVAIHDRLTLGGAWAIANLPGSRNVLHDHPDSYLSGVLYIKAPKNSGNIVFTDPRKVEVMMRCPPRGFRSPLRSHLNQDFCSCFLVGWIILLRKTKVMRSESA